MRDMDKALQHYEALVANTSTTFSEASLGLTLVSNWHPENIFSNHQSEAPFELCILTVSQHAAKLEMLRKRFPDQAIAIYMNAMERVVRWFEKSSIALKKSEYLEKSALLFAKALWDEIAKAKEEGVHETPIFINQQEKCREVMAYLSSGFLDEEMWHAAKSVLEIQAKLSNETNHISQANRALAIVCWKLNDLESALSASKIAYEANPEELLSLQAVSAMMLCQKDSTLESCSGVLSQIIEHKETTSKELTILAALAKGASNEALYQALLSSVLN